MGSWKKITPDIHGYLFIRWFFSNVFIQVNNIAKLSLTSPYLAAQLIWRIKIIALLPENEIQI